MVCAMAFGSFDQDRSYLESKFQKNVCPESSGLENQVLKQHVAEFADSMAELPTPVLKARAFEYVAQHIQIDTDPRDWFPAFGCWNRLDRPLSGLLSILQERVCKANCSHGQLWNDLRQTGLAGIGIDFDHSVPDWNVMFQLGFPGLLERIREYRKKRQDAGQTTPATDAYFDGMEISYLAIMELLGRLQHLAASRASESPRLAMLAECLDQLRIGAPRNIYESLQFIYLFFFFSEHIDRMQVRSLGNLDNLLRPYFEHDLDTGTFTEAQIREFFDYFMMQYASIDNYWGHPFYLGGTDANGNSRINRLSYLILEEFDKLSIPTPKIQLKIAQNTPDAFLDAALKMIRHGNSSLVFVSEEGILRSMTELGMTPEDARTCDIRGCYEIDASGKHNSNTTLPAHINMLKPLELVFHNGVDPKTGIEIGEKTGSLEELETFDDFYRAYVVQLESAIEKILSVVNDFERFLSDINPTNVFSATIRHSLETGRDAFHNGSYRNNTSLNNTGFASTVDSLEAIRVLVYEQKVLTLQEFKQVLADNWQGHELLRLRASHCNRYGNGIESVDRIAGWLNQFVGVKVNGRPNARGGVWSAGGFAARAYIILGKKTGASPDGRFDGEEVSKNISPVQGADINGVTALIRSSRHFDPANFPTGYPLDVMLHPTAVAGDDGLAAWRNLVRVYLERGFAIHFNIFDAETLKVAQLHPEKYAGLQIRVCGWNVHFIEMSKEEQDMYIRRAETL